MDACMRPSCADKPGAVPRITLSACKTSLMMARSGVRGQCRVVPRNLLAKKDDGQGQRFPS